VARELIHPGEFLADELQEIGMSPTEFSRQIDVPANRVSQIISGKRSVSADTALRIGHFFDTGPELWMNLQKSYDIDPHVKKQERQLHYCHNGKNLQQTDTKQ